MHMHITLRSVSAVLLSSVLLTLPAHAAPFGTFFKPFSAQSPWNARPVGAVLGDYQIPKSDYSPALVEGTWSTGVFLAGANDKPMAVYPLPGRPGVWDPDAEAVHDSIVIPRWPAGVIPANGSDGHADIVDPISGVVHSFFELRFMDGKWRTGQYAWTRLDGRGWGEPGHYFQGARAAAVPTMGGVIRTHEVGDGDKLFRHALAMSLTFNGLSANPPYVFPATSADRGFEKNTGRIPEGALLMLPPDYDTTRIQDERLRKVAETLKVFGAYVVDRNGGTPFAIYVENGTRLNLHKGGWDNNVARELDRMRAALRQVVKVDGWLDGNGEPMQMEQRLNLLSMRGPWKLINGERGPGVFDTREQALLFPSGTGKVTQSNNQGNVLHLVSWAKPKPGALYRLTAYATGGATMRLQLFDSGSFHAKLYDSGDLVDGKVVEFHWPEGQRGVALIASSGGTATPSSVRGQLVAVDPPVPALPR